MCQHDLTGFAESVLFFFIRDDYCASLHTFNNFQSTLLLGHTYVLLVSLHKYISLLFTVKVKIMKLTWNVRRHDQLTHTYGPVWTYLVLGMWKSECYLSNMLLRENATETVDETEMC